MPKYHLFYLEIALKDPKDPHIYAFQNISHIPTKKLIEIFQIDIKKDPHILEGYFLTRKMYLKHKTYILEHIGPINLAVFEYSLRQYGAQRFAEIRKFYKKDMME